MERECFCHGTFMYCKYVVWYVNMDVFLLSGGQQSVYTRSSVTNKEKTKGTPPGESQSEALQEE